MFVLEIVQEIDFFDAMQCDLMYFGSHSIFNASL